MITIWQALLFGFVQGITELFPISSLGHSVILPRLVGWHINQSDPFFLTFLVATHAATALVLFGFFWKDWVRILTGLFRTLKNREITASDTDGRLAWLLVVSTIPAGLLGVLFEKPLQNLFANPQLVAFILMCNGILLFGAELLRRKKKELFTGDNDKRIAQLSWFKGIKVGTLQAIALIPGFSRTGAAMTGGLLVGLSHEDAARFSFLLATPIIAAAALLKLPDLLTPEAKDAILPSLVGALMAGVAAYFSVRFLLKYFETKTLLPFALYCFLVGLGVSFFFLVY